MEFKVWKEEGNASFRANDLESAYSSYSKSMELLTATLEELSMGEDNEESIIEVGKGKEIDLDDTSSVQTIKKASPQLYERYKDLAAIFSNRALVQLKIMEKNEDEGNNGGGEGENKHSMDVDVSFNTCAKDCRSALSALKDAKDHAAAVFSNADAEKELSNLRVKASFRLSQALGKQALLLKHSNFLKCKQISGEAVKCAKDAFQNDPTNKAILDWIQHLSGEIAYLEAKTAAKHAVKHLRANRDEKDENTFEYRKLLVQQEALACFSVANQTNAPPEICLKIGCETAIESFKTHIGTSTTEDGGDRACDIVAEIAVSFAVGSTAAPAGLRLSAVVVSRIVNTCLLEGGTTYEESLEACAVSAAAVAMNQSPNDRVKASLDVVKAVKNAGASESLAEKLAAAYVKIEPSTPVFIASKIFDGKMEGYIFKMGKKGVGYYLDQGVEEEGPAELELGRDDPMFHDMDDEKFNAMKNILQMTEAQVERLPLEHQETVVMFRQMYKDRVKMKKNPNPTPEGDGDKEAEDQKKKRNPNEWLEKMNDYLKKSDEKRKEFDLEKCERILKEERRVAEEDKQKVDTLRRELVDKEARELFGSSSQKTGEKKKTTKAQKKKNGAKEKEKQRKKNLDTIFNFGNNRKSKSTLDADIQ